jgi:hypothetical protein
MLGCRETMHRIGIKLRQKWLIQAFFALSSGVLNPAANETIERGFKPRKEGDRDLQSLARRAIGLPMSVNRLT